MTIKVISQSTTERENETRDLFMACRPYLDKGIGLCRAVQIVKGLNHQSYTQRKWYRELAQYCEEQGYRSRI